jgi:NADH-quinone oxidoreductase subunit M
VNNAPYLSLLIATPLLGAFLTALFAKRLQGRHAKQVGLGISLLTLVLFIYVALQYELNSPNQFQLVEKYSWIPSFGVNYALGVDGLGLLMLAMTIVLVPVVLLAGWNDIAEEDTSRYVSLVLALEAVVIGVFTATDLFLFYVFFEAMLIPMYFLIGRFGGPERKRAAIKFLVFSLIGGLVLLVALISLWVTSIKLTGVGSFDLEFLSTLGIDPGTQRWLFFGFFFAFAVKAPLVPVHSWLPDAAAQATPGSAVLLIGILDKVGTFGMLRFLIPIMPDASVDLAPVAIGFAVVSIFYGAVMAIGQNDMKRLMAYVSISHFGFIVLGIFAFTTQGISGSMFYMLSHGLSTAALFLAAGYLFHRTKSQQIDEHSGVFQVTPLLAGVILFGALSSVALPGLASFIAEFTVLLGAFARYPIVAAIATIGIVVAAVYALWLYQRTMTGRPSANVTNISDLDGREVIAIAPVIFLTILLGLIPQPVFNLVNESAELVMESSNVVDPPSLVDQGEK